MTYILKRKIIYHAKKSFKCINLFFLLLIGIIAIILIKYKPSYAVTISGEVVGYVNDKTDFQARINNEILAHSGNVAFVTIPFAAATKLVPYGAPISIPVCVLPHL